MARGGCIGIGGKGMGERPEDILFAYLGFMELGHCRLKRGIMGSL